MNWGVVPSLRFRAAAAFTLACAGLAVATACGPGFLDGLTGGASPGGPGEVDSGEFDIGCVGLTPPDAAPTIEDGPDVPPLTFAFETVRVSPDPSLDSGAPPPLGFNQDHLCSCPERQACTPPDAGSAVRQQICDGDGGTDNGLAGFFTSLALLIPEFRTDFAGERIREGRFTVIADLSSWNGTPNDPQVRLRIVMSSGMDREASGGRRKPLYDGTDVWSADPGSILQGTTKIGQDCRVPTGDLPTCIPSISDPRAFVRDGRLYARPFNTENILPLVLLSSVGRIGIDLANATFVADLTTGEDGRPRMSGEIAGRWAASSIFNAVGNIENPFPLADGGPSALCESAGDPQGLYGTMKVGVCAGLDLAADQRNDSRPSMECAAVSAALSFTASPATLGHIVDNAPNITNCIDWKDDCSR